MTTSDKSTLAALFQNGDVPTGQNYSDMIDSSVNLAEPTRQSMIASLETTELVASMVSASNMTVVNSLGASTVAANVVQSTTVSANIVYASAGVIQPVGIVSAAGTTQGAAAALAYIINRGAGVVDGATTGFAIPANKTGLTQYVINGGASANLWPPTGGTINALSANAAFAMAANIPYVILHITASAYAVK